MFEIETGTIFRKDPAAWDNFTRSPTGEVGRDLIKRGEKLKQLARGSIKSKSGRLARSLTMNYYRGTLNPYVEVGSDLEYSYFVHEGTKPHQIRPKTHRKLRFNVGGKIVYVDKVDHPGTRPTKFLSRHLGSVVK